MKKVILLFGGQSLEHEVSLESASSILENIDEKKYQVTPIVISKEGTWYFYEGNYNHILDWKNENLRLVENIIQTLKKADIVFPMIHGGYGEDGRIQSLLELFDIPYVGCNSKTSMICMDKEYMKIIAMKNDIPILPYQVFSKDTIKSLDYPVIVKPANGGSSIGIGVANNKKELQERYKEASCCDRKVIIEKYAKVRELEIGFLQDKKKSIFSDIGEILTEGEVYSYDRKYVHSMSTLKEAELPKEIKEKIQNMAKRLATIFQLEGMARIDFFYEEETKMIYFNEINTIPGFTTISMYPKLWETSKISYQKLISKLLESS